MKYTYSFAKKAFSLGAIVAFTTFAFIPSVYADVWSGYTDNYSYPDTSYTDSYSYPDTSYTDNYSYPDTTYTDNYSYPDTSASYVDNYSYPDTSVNYADNYSYPDYSASYVAPVQYASYSPSYASYSAPAQYASYVAPVQYASYQAPAQYATYHASYVAPTYTSAAYNYNTYTNPAPVVQTQTLQATCYAQNTNPYVNQSVTWTANATGGNGAYTYTWNGLNLNGTNGPTVTTTYNTLGSETATVTVYSNGQSITANCGSIYVGTYQNVDNTTVTCYPNVNSAPVGSAITWTAVINSNNGGVNYTYNWVDNGTGYGSVNSNSSVYTTTYTTAGTKAPTLTITPVGYNNGISGYNGLNAHTVSCQTVSILGNGYNAGYNYTYPVNGSLASLSSVSLNQVPYTGLADSASFWEFMVGLFLASLVGTWYFMKVYARGKRRYMISLFKKDNLAKKLGA